MRVFRYALTMAVRKPLFFLIYAVGLSFMGVAMALAVASSQPADTAAAVARPQVDWAVVDRDGSELSRGLVEGLAGLGTREDVADNRLAMEEAVAQGQVDCLFIVPPGFGDDFLAAARAGRETPSVEAARAAAETVSVAVLPSERAEGADGGVNAFTFYLQWSIYTTVASVVACTAVLFSTFNRTDVRRRDLASPETYASYTLQVAGAALAVTLACWGVATAVGLAFFGADAAAMGPAGLAATLGASLVFCLVPLAVSFLAGQFGCGLGGANAIGNLLGMAMSFLGGAWISLSLLGPEVQAVARFTPGWWYTDALARARDVAGSAGTDAALEAIAVDLAVVLLFAVALFLVALVVGKLREQTAEAGGNGAVEGA